jgi:predicted dehydrogenase
LGICHGCAEAETLRRWIAEGRDPQVSGRQGANTTSWLEAAERSAASGESVRLSLTGRAS